MMRIPRLDVAVEPFESGKVVYLPTAPLTSKEKSRGRIVLRLRITNHEAALTVISVRGDEFTASLKNARKNNLYLRGLSGYDRSGTPNYVAFWSK